MDSRVDEIAEGASRTRSDSMKHADWMAAATEEYRRLLGVLRDLSPADWSTPTDCSAWDVRQMVAHLVGAGESNARLRESARQMRLGKKAMGDRMLVDGINDVQVSERADRTPEQLLVDLAEVAVRGVRARRRLPAPLRAVRVPFGPPLGVKPLGYLMDRIYTRDQWMHRIDICRATGRPLQVTADHDGRLVADVVAEWARLHGKPFRLTLAGPAGGVWSHGEGASYELDAIELARVVSGRGAGEGLLAQQVPF